MLSTPIARKSEGAGPWTEPVIGTIAFGAMEPQRQHGQRRQCTDDRNGHAHFAAGKGFFAQDEDNGKAEHEAPRQTASDRSHQSPGAQIEVVQAF